MHLRGLFPQYVSSPSKWACTASHHMIPCNYSFKLEDCGQNSLLLLFYIFLKNICLGLWWRTAVTKKYVIIQWWFVEILLCFWEFVHIVFFFCSRQYLKTKLCIFTLCKSTITVFITQKWVHKCSNLHFRRSIPVHMLYSTRKEPWQTGGEIGGIWSLSLRLTNSPHAYQFGQSCPIWQSKPKKVGQTQSRVLT